MSNLSHKSSKPRGNPSIWTDASLATFRELWETTDRSHPEISYALERRHGLVIDPKRLAGHADKRGFSRRHMSKHAAFRSQEAILTRSALRHLNAPRVAHEDRVVVPPPRQKQGPFSMIGTKL